MTENINVLVVEDESLVAMGLVRNIKKLGYNALNYATNVKTTREIFSENRVDILIMDIDLKDEINGVELYESLNTTSQVIYTSGNKKDAILCSAIKTNPIGYLTKPYLRNDLKVMLKMATYKILVEQENQPRIEDIGDEYSFHYEKDELYHKNELVKLNKKELQLLKFLLDANGGYVSYKIIEDEIYADQVINSATIKTFVHRFKIKLDKKNLCTEYGYGIKFV